MLSGKIVEKFQMENVGKVTLRYPTMKDAEELKDYLNSLIGEKAEISRQEKITLEEEVDRLSDRLQKVERERWSPWSSK